MQDLARDVIRASLRGRLTKRTSQSRSNVYNISKKQLGDLSHLIDGMGIRHQTPGDPARPNPFPCTGSFAVRVMADSED